LNNNPETPHTLPGRFWKITLINKILMQVQQDPSEKY
jgi:hypothetical protein